MNKEKIKSCPFCGGAGSLSCRYSPKARIYFVAVRCGSCKAQGASFTEEENQGVTGWKSASCDAAVNAWNKRAGQDPESIQEGAEA